MHHTRSEPQAVGVVIIYEQHVEKHLFFYDYKLLDCIFAK